MKLEPIFVLPPKKPRGKNRLLIGCALALGLGIGLPVGLSMGRAAAHARDPMYDPMHEWLRQLADDNSPIDQLLHNHIVFLTKLGDYKGDPRLWQGAARLANAVVQQEELPERRSLAAQLLKALDHDVPIAAEVRRLELQLIRIAK